MAVKAFINELWFKVSMSLPGSLQVGLTGGEPVVIRGRSLDPSIQLLAHYSAGQPSLDTLPIDIARAAAAAGYAALSGPPRREIAVRDIQLDGSQAALPARVCLPEHGRANGVLVLFFHPGGWVFGDLNSGHSFCAQISARAGATVVSVDYRLAPEHPFPAAVDDAIAAYEWALSNALDLNCDPEKIIVAGESAGGNLAAAICQHAKSAGLRQPCGQYLASPVTDLKNRSASYTELGDSFPLTADLMEWFIDKYVAPSHADDVRASVLLAADLTGLAPAIVITAGFDPLVDEGAAYAERLAASGVPVTYHCESGSGHGILTMAGLSRSCKAASDRCTALLVDFIAALE